MINGHQAGGHDDRADHRDGAEVSADSGGRVGASYPVADRRAKSQLLFERVTSFRNQVVTRMMLAARFYAVVRRFSRRTLGRVDRALRDFDFGVPRTARKFFDRMPVAIARGKIHRGKIAVGAQHRIDRAHALEKIRPINRRHQAHAGNHVADRDVHRALPLMYFADDIVGRGSLHGEARIEPLQCGSHLGILIAQPLNQLHGKRGRHRRRVEILEHSLSRFRFLAVGPQQPVRDQVGPVPLRAAAADLFRRAPQVFDQHDSKRDRHRPQLADRQRLHALVRLHELRQRLRIEIAVSVRDVSPRDAENARVPFQRAVDELGQLPVISARQIVANLSNLLFDDVKIVDQPLRRRRDRALLANSAGNVAIRLEQCPAVVAHARRNRPAAPGIAGDALRDGERLAMLFKPLDAEQFGTDQFVGMREAGGRCFRRAKK